MTVLCVDAGTSLVKCVAFDAEGREQHVESAPTEVNRPAPGHSEQDMDAVYEAVAETIRACAQAVDEPVELLATTAQGDGCWLVADDGRPTGPAILWNDARAAEIVEEWERGGQLEAAFRINGSVAFSGLPHAILSWLQRHDPDRLERSAALLFCNGWIFESLTGERAMDPSDASNPWLDVRDGRYSERVLELFGLESLGRLLPPLRDGTDRVAEIKPEAARALGLPAGLPVTMAPFDVVATTIGVGAIEPETACGILGTTLSVVTVTRDPDPDLSGPPVGMTLCTGMQDRWARAYATLAGTEVIDWACELLALDEPAELTRLAESADAASPGPAFLPYLSPAGERAPFRNSAARGSLVGVTLDHDRPSVARAVLEGLSLVVRDCLEAGTVRPKEIRVSGGGAASELWCQLIADAAGIRVVTLADTQSGAKGALITALVATGRADGFDEATQLVRLGRTYEPDAGQRERLDESYRHFISLRDSSAEHHWPLIARREEQPGRSAA
ncbi:MAG TPA: FGGY-family carbohydrate kinase [Thermoleophilaceae bacterium]|nr:FGGY-family carbohydrate kinase [Thermoleophilaceae bacterium]